MERDEMAETKIRMVECEEQEKRSGREGRRIGGGGGRELGGT